MVDDWPVQVYISIYSNKLDCLLNPNMASVPEKGHLQIVQAQCI